MTDDTQVRKLAAEAAKQFEKFTRAGTEEEFWKTRDGAPEWIGDMVRAAHGDMLPDDWRYEFIVQAVLAIDDANGDADLDELAYEIEPDIYHRDLYKWLGSDLGRAAYVDDAVLELGLPSVKEFSITNIIGLGQIAEKQEVFQSVLQFLRERAEEIEDEEDAEE